MFNATQLTNFEQALKDGLAEITGEGKNERIRYKAANHAERWADPEEKVRAEFWAELICKYQYAPERIRFEVTVPRRTPHDRADIVIYNDDELKSPYFVFKPPEPQAGSSTKSPRCGFNISTVILYLATSNFRRRF